MRIRSYPWPTTIEAIVSAYVRLRNRRALENMRDLRRHLLGTLQSTSGIDPAQSRDAVLEDMYRPTRRYRTVATRRTDHSGNRRGANVSGKAWKLPRGARGIWRHTY